MLLKCVSLGLSNWYTEKLHIREEIKNWVTPGSIPSWEDERRLTSLELPTYYRTKGLHSVHKILQLGHIQSILPHDLFKIYFNLILRLPMHVLRGPWNGRI